MANIFEKTRDYSNSPNRNSFDLSYQNNLTLKFGQLTPVFARAVVPGDSFQIRPTFGFNYMPMVFPVQTRMKATLHFFYVRNRTLWKDWPDFIGKTKDGLTPPYMMFGHNNRDMLNTCSIGDYMGIPTVTYGKYGDAIQVNADDVHYYDSSYNAGSYEPNPLYGGQYVSPLFGYSTLTPVEIYNKIDSDEVTKYTEVVDKTTQISSYIANSRVLFLSIPEQYRGKFTSIPVIKYKFGEKCSIGIQLGNLDGEFIYYNYYSPSFGTDYSESISTLENWNKATFVALYCDEVLSLASLEYFYMQFVAADSTGATENSNLPLSSLPFANLDNPDGLPISALPFRAYEAIYNSFYRDSRNNPFKINGVEEYNKWIPTDEGGADTNRYKLRFRNWESDFLTTAVQSPQQGVAPLVGVTSTGTMTFQDESGNTYTAQATVGDDGDTITGISVHSSDMPQGTLRALVDTISSGISISDFRNVNALQRWLEINMRRGLKYRDQIKAHFGVNVEYKELDMPEFIGGCSEEVVVNRISQTVDQSEESPLGMYGGQASVLGTSSHSISHYCDEHGWIIGIMCITPVPNYSQLLNKELIKNVALDYYFPEFGHIGYQPIFNREVSPLQAKRYDDVNGTDTLNEVFGYQRAWYEYIASTDEVHGNFRNSLRNYLINRTFDDSPELSEAFLLVDPDQINDIFAYTRNTDKIFGQIYFDVKAKRPIPELGIPRLEA